MRSAFLLLLAVPMQAQNWPGFRGPNASGIQESAKIPDAFDGAKGTNILWKTEIPGLAHSSPVVWGDRVYVTTAISSDPKAVFRHGAYGDVEPSNDVSKHVWKVYALDRKTGKIEWERVAVEGAPKTKRHPKSSQASSSPATDGRYVVAFFGSEGLYTFDTSGKLVWKKDFGVLNSGWFFDPDYEWGTASSPIIYNDVVILQADIQKNSFLAAFRLTDGKEVWRVQRDEIPGWGTPTVVKSGNRTEIVTNSTKAIRGHDVETGKQLWQLTGNSEVTVTTPVASEGLIYVANGYPPIQPIYAIKMGASGDITLKGESTTNEFVAWSYKRGGPYMPTAIVYQGILYTCANNGVLTAYDAKTGEKIYQQRINRKPEVYSSSPVAADGKLYFTSEDGDVNIVKAGKEFQLIATNPMGDVLMATPALAADMMIIRGQHSVFAIGKKE